jgi:transcription initiation factor TFIIIB Brf1 subunit/transcription initiation factor TFIIB
MDCPCGGDTVSSDYDERGNVTQWTCLDCGRVLTR